MDSRSRLTVDLSTSVLAVAIRTRYICPRKNNAHNRRIFDEHNNLQSTRIIHQTKYDRPSWCAKWARRSRPRLWSSPRAKNSRAKRTTTKKDKPRWKKGDIHLYILPLHLRNLFIEDVTSTIERVELGTVENRKPPGFCCRSVRQKKNRSERISRSCERADSRATRESSCYAAMNVTHVTAFYDGRTSSGTSKTLGWVTTSISRPFLPYTISYIVISQRLLLLEMTFNSGERNVNNWRPSATIICHRVKLSIIYESFIT